MSITVIGGTVSLNNNPRVKAIVETINFPTANRIGGQVPAGANGTMTLVSPPDYQNFNRAEVLDYVDGNNNNNSRLTVTSTLGPSKYKVTKN